VREPLATSLLVRGDEHAGELDNSRFLGDDLPNFEPDFGREEREEMEDFRLYRSCR